MINTQTQIDSLIDLAVIQRTELKQLIESLPQLRDHLSSEIERNLEEIEPAIRSELEQFVAARALDTQAKTSAELGAKIDAMARNLESTTAAKYSVLMTERLENANLLAKAEARIEDAASMLTHAVKEIVTDELSRFPRAGEIDQLRKEFAEPRGLNPRGRWLPDETYQRLDLVTINGDSFVSNIDSNRERPSRTAGDWTLSAARGNGGGGGGATTLTDLVAVPSNGQLLIGNGSGFTSATLTAGENITITNGPGSITIAAAGGSLAAFEDGTAAAPSLNFTNEPTTGLFRASANVLGFAVNGVSRATMTTTGVTVTGTITPTGSVHAAAGSVGNPSLAFNADQDTGLFAIGANNLGVAAGGAKVLDVATTGLGVTGTLSVSGVATLGAGAILNTPASGTLTNATGLPISTGVSGLGTNVAAFLATPTSANLATAVTDETGTGALVFGTSPTLTTPISATLTAPASTNLTLAGGSSGASLVLGQGTGYAVATSTDTGTAGEQIALVASATTSGTPTAGYGPSLRFFRKGNDGGAAGSAASVRAVAITGTGGSQYNSNLTLAARLAGNMVDVLTATGAGNVGIGTATPTNGQLEISGNSDAASSPNRPRLALTNTAGTAVTWSIQPWSTSGDANLSIYRSGSTGNILLAAAGGNVGIGTTSPAVRLNVADADNGANGTIRLGSSSVYGTIKNEASSTGKLVLDSVGSGSAGGISLRVGGVVGLGINNVGDVSISSSTAGSASAGALVVTGGLSAGNNGNASYFGGAVTAPSLTLSTTPLAFASGGTGAASSGQALAKLTNIATTVTSGTPVTLTNTSANYQIFTGSTTQTVILPVTSTLETGWSFSICNNSTAVINIQTSAGTALFSNVPVGTTALVKCIATGSTAVTDWEANITEFSTFSGTGSVVLNSNPSLTALTCTGAANITGAATSTHVLGTNLTTGTVTIGGTATTNLITLGQSTATHTLSIDAGATASGAVKTINIGTGGLAGSTTAIAIGSADGTSTTTINGAVTIGNTVNTVSPTSPNRTITMVVNGVTLYIAAKLTND